MEQTNRKLSNNLVKPPIHLTKRNQQRTLKLPACRSGANSTSSTNLCTLLSGIFIAAAPFALGVIAAEPISVLAPELVDRMVELIPYLGMSLCLMTVVTVAVWFRRSNRIIYSVAPAMSLLIGIFCGLACIF